jgi:hypothetical protein
MCRALGKPGGLCRLHCHRRTFAEGAVEHEALAGSLGELRQETIVFQAALHILIRNVEGARNNAVLAPFLVLPEIDQGRIGPAE